MTSKLLAMMMLPKIDYMPLTVVGSPTIVDGVVSGFSTVVSGGDSNNYITFTNNFTLIDTDNFEFVCRGNYERVNTSQYFFYCQHFFIYHSDANKLQFAVVDIDNKNKYINGFYTPTGDFVYVKLVKNGTTYTSFASDNGKNWTQLATSEITPATTRTSTNNRFGTSSAGYNIFRGSIDFNNSYIKLNNTKYQFQFTMPLTKVGNPTIVDGVVSGFSSGNYIQAGIFSLINNKNNFELKVKFRVSDLSYTQDLLFANSYGIGIRIRDTKKIQLFLSSTRNSWDIANQTSSNTINENTDYYLKLINNGSSYILKISTDDINYDDFITITSSATIYSSSNNANFGTNNNDSGNFLSGSIDFNANNSYIVTDETKYILTLP